jgi:Lamin Tail Domain/Secretion system C-terminal sorting domain
LIDFPTFDIQLDRLVHFLTPTPKVRRKFAGTKKQSMRLFKLIVFSLLLSATAQGQIVINEIMYNSPESGNDSLEYIELYNAGNAAVNLNGYTLAAVGYTFTSLSIPAGGYVVLAKSPTGIANNFGFSGSLAWPTTEALNNSGELLSLKNAAGAVIDSVTFSDSLPWDVAPDGEGSSLSLCNATADNGVYLPWVASTTNSGSIINGVALLGTPGSANLVTCGAPPTTIAANNDSYTLAIGQSSEFSVLTNDIFPAGITGNVVLPVSTTTLGTLTTNGTTVTFTANGQCGEASFDYYIIAANPNQNDTATVFLTVSCPGDYTVYTISSLIGENATGVADSIGVQAQVTGIMHGLNLRPSGLQFTIIDTDNGDGIGVFSDLSNFGGNFQEGDEVTVKGTVEQFNGLTQIAVDTAFVISAGNNLVDPITIAAGTQLDESTESAWLTAVCATFDPADWDTVGNDQGFNITLGNGIVARFDKDVPYYSQPAPAFPITILGTGGQFDGTTPYTGGYQFLVMDMSLCVSTNDVAFSQFSMSPNPATDLVKIELPEGADRIIVLDAMGRQIVAMAATTQINIADWTPGVYFIEIDGSFGRVGRQLIKK